MQFLRNRHFALKFNICEEEHEFHGLKEERVRNGFDFILANLGFGKDHTGILRVFRAWSTQTFPRKPGWLCLRGEEEE
ncbi:hypothetical protein IMY05_005G0192500 [Salix suchowensis]|nr:hypothetical protein IMY05_005G0192500 [Salix suchowensis]